MKNIFSLKNRLLPVVIWLIGILLSIVCIVLAAQIQDLYLMVYAWLLFIWAPIILPTIVFVIQIFKKEYSLIAFLIYILYIFLWCIIAYYSYIALGVMFEGAMSV